MNTNPQKEKELQEAIEETAKQITKDEGDIEKEVEMQDEQSAFVQLSAKAAQDFAVLIYQLQDATGDTKGFGELNMHFPLKSGQVLTMKCEVTALEVVE